MTGWTALVPIKAPGHRKTRLAPYLSPDQRETLAEDMLAHVAEVLRASPSIMRAVLLAPDPPEDGFDGWIADEGRGLNVELDAARAALGGDLLILHADLPRLTVEDVETLLAEAVDAPAIAPDRHRKLHVVDAPNSHGLQHRRAAGRRQRPPAVQRRISPSRTRTSR